MKTNFCRFCMLCLVYSKNVDQTENTVSRRKHAIRNEGSQRSSDQADSSMTEAATEPTQWEPKSTSPAANVVLDDDDDNTSNEDEKSDAISTFGDVLSSPLQTKIKQTKATSVSSLSLSFTITKVMPVTIMLRVNVTTDASVWCGAWKVGENMNLQYLQMNSLGKFVHGRIR